MGLQEAKNQFVEESTELHKEDIGNLMDYLTDVFGDHEFEVTLVMVDGYERVWVDGFIFDALGGLIHPKIWCEDGDWRPITKLNLLHAKQWWPEQQQIATVSDIARSNHMVYDALLGMIHAMGYGAQAKELLKVHDRGEFMHGRWSG